jgi:hypothetical protein
MGSIGLVSFFLKSINRGGHPNVPISVNRFNVTGIGNRRGKVTINRYLTTAVEAFARHG